MKRDYDTTVARIAGNILSGMTRIDAPDEPTELAAAAWAVRVARAIVKETKRTEIDAIYDDYLTAQAAKKADREQP